jgi:uncharacterized protein (DUF39 family)/Pyruvate/2-oxoacid:ferredoxin oxidoreductase delta subunit
MSKTIQDINKKIDKGTVRVVRADEMTKIVREVGPERAAEEVDVVTTGTFGAMCSSGVWLNFGHSEPPIKMTKVLLNDVEAYAGVAAVDAYLGATQPSQTRGIEYGGAHVIEDLLNGKPVVLRAVSYGTDCYPRKRIITQITLDDLNTALMSNPRNGYQRYNAATNSTAKAIYTYMGKLLPRLGNVTFSGAGELSPLMNDPQYQTIGIGTRIFLGGAQGYIVGSGTQHSPQSQFGTLMVQGHLKQMSSRFIRAATFPGYGCSLYVGIGVPVPVLDSEIAKNTGISDEEIFTQVLDYGIPSRNRPALKKVSYAELKSGFIEINGRRVRTSPLSSYAKAKEIADALKSWIKKGEFKLSTPAEYLARTATVKPLEVRAFLKEKKRRATQARKWIGNLYWDEARCVQCGLCLSLCPKEVFGRDQNWNVRVKYEDCDACGICFDACPLKAIFVAPKKKNEKIRSKAQRNDSDDYRRRTIYSGR